MIYRRVRQKRNRDVDRFKYCHWCGGENTEQIGLSDDDTKLVYVGWCLACFRDYGYSIHIENVHDREGRI